MFIFRHTHTHGTRMVDRVKFILNTSGKYVAGFSARIIPTMSHIAEYFNLPPPHDVSAIQEFLSNEELTILTASAGTQNIQFTHELAQDTEFSIIFYKIPQTNHERSEQKNLSSHHAEIGLLTLQGGMVKSIYNSVSRVFSAHSSKVIKFVC